MESADYLSAFAFRMAADFRRRPYGHEVVAGVWLVAMEQAHDEGFPAVDDFTVDADAVTKFVCLSSGLWFFEVWPHPTAGFVHIVGGDIHRDGSLFGLAKGIAAEAVPIALEWFAHEYRDHKGRKMPAFGSGLWVRQTEPFTETSAADNKFFNRYLFRNDAEYLRDGAGIVKARKPKRNAMAN